MSNTRRFSEEEVHALLRYASARQQEKHEHTRLEEGLTLEEIERIAKDAGIDSSFLREAVIDLESNEPEAKHNAFVGGPINFKIERFVEGRLDEEDHALIVAELRNHFPKKDGKYSQLGSMLDWKIGTGTSTINLHLEPSGDNTRIVWKENMDDTAVLLYIFPIIFACMAVALSFKNASPHLMSIGISSLSYLAARFLYNSTSQNSQTRAQEAMKKIVTIAEEHAESTLGDNQVREKNAPLLDLEEDAQDAKEESGQKNRTRRKTG